MPTHAFAASAYAQHSASVSSPRGIEYKAFNRITAQLHAASQEGVPFYKLAEAVHMNTRLWTTLATDLLSEDNQLPVELRAQLFSLAEYVRKTSLNVLRGKADVSEIVEINSLIMRGLRESDQPEADASTPRLVDAGTAPAAEAQI